MCPPVIFTFIPYVTFPSLSIHFLLKYCKMLRCGKAPAEHMHMHEVKLMPLGDTDVTTLGRWLSNHDNMVQCCILPGRALRMASPSCRQDSDIPSARSAECPGDGSQPVVTEMSTLPSIWPPHPHSGAWRSSPLFIGLSTPTKEQWMKLPIRDCQGCQEKQPTILQL